MAVLQLFAAADAAITNASATNAAIAHPTSELAIKEEAQERKTTQGSCTRDSGRIVVAISIAVAITITVTLAR